MVTEGADFGEVDVDESLRIAAAVDSEVNPWDVPAVPLPRYVTAAWCDQVIGTPAGDTLVRANLVTSRRDSLQRISWRAFWQTVGVDPILRDRVIGLLNADRRRAVDALDDGGLSGAPAGRARDFINNIDGALARMKREAGGPLGWASPRYAQLPHKAREVIEELAFAIDDFGTGRISGDQLQAVLPKLGLDPAGRRRPPRRRLAGDAEGE